MIKFDNTRVYGFFSAVQGMRNSYNSRDKSDSIDGADGFILGKADLALMQKLCKAGADHRKFLRQIFVSVDITAPLYWWKQFDTYKIGTTSNSTSTMHTITAKPFEAVDFSCEQLEGSAWEAVDIILAVLNDLRQEYLQNKDMQAWYSIIQLLPSGYNQLRTITLNYEVALACYNARRSHKLDEWQDFCKWTQTLPYFADITG